MAEIADKREILRKINWGELFIIDKTDKAKSDLWLKFSLVVDKEGKRFPYVQCKNCKTILSYVSSKGSSHLNRHNCTSSPCTSSSISTRPIDSFVTVKNKLSNVEKKSLTEACVKFCATDIRPFEVVAGAGFKNLCHYILSVGARYGNINIEDILPHPTTIRRTALDMASNLRSTKVADWKKMISNGLCAATTDMWTDDFKKVSYTTLTLHYINYDWQMESKVFFTCDFPKDDRKTGENIRKEIKRRLQGFGMDPEIAMKNLVFVTDQGANIIKALSPYKRLNCCAHVLNTILRNTFEENFLNDNLPEISCLIKNCKRIVTFFKQSGLNQKLERTLQQEVETRWNSKLTMLNSLYDQWDSVNTVLRERGESSRIDDVDKGLLKETIHFLQPFMETSKALEKDTEPTLHLTVLLSKKLLTKISEGAASSNNLTLLYERCNHFITSKFQVVTLHNVATFLIPSCRQLRMLGEVEKQATLDEIRKMIEEYQKYRCLDSNTTISKGETDQNEAEPPAKKASCLFSEFMDEIIPPATETEQDITEREIAAYQTLSIPTDIDFFESKNLLNWWKVQESNLPFLSLVAKKVLSIPATSSSSERVFSEAGRTLESRRTNLKPETMDALIFLHGNMQ